MLCKLSLNLAQYKIWNTNNRNDRRSSGAKFSVFALSFGVFIAYRARVKNQFKVAGVFNFKKAMTLTSKILYRAFKNVFLRRLIDHSRIRHKHARENVKVRLGWTNIKHGGQHLHFFARWP